MLPVQHFQALLRCRVRPGKAGAQALQEPLLRLRMQSCLSTSALFGRAGGTIVDSIAKACRQIPTDECHKRTQAHTSCSCRVMARCSACTCCSCMRAMYSSRSRHCAASHASISFRLHSVSAHAGLLSVTCRPQSSMQHAGYFLCATTSICTELWKCTCQSGARN